MSNQCSRWSHPFRVLLTLFAGFIGAVISHAQSFNWQPENLPIFGLGGLTTTDSKQAAAQPAHNSPRRAPLARLIENPDQTDGTPPYALTDQTGTIQRYVEPVPHIDLSAYVGQIVAVRDDSGPTLLASQLELPRQPLYPMVSERAGAYPASAQPRPWARPQQPRTSGVEQAQFIDNDDSSVQLLPDGGGAVETMPADSGQIPLLGEEYPGYPGEMMQGAMYGPGCGPQCCDPMSCGPGCMPGPGPMVAPYPQMGVYPTPMAYPVQQQCAPAPQQRAQFSADVEFMFYRVHVNEDAVGKLSETYEFTPRVILNWRNVGLLDGRVRYWNYERDTNVLGGGDVRFEFNVLDIEAVHYFEGRRSQLALSAGIRFADLQIADINDQQCGIDMIGLTMAADGLTPIVAMQGGYCGWVYGGRLSLLGGDWGGDDNCLFIDHQVRDDNIVVTELYAGAEVARRCGYATVRARALFEMQNWRSDVLGEDADVDSIGLLGPAVQIGADF
jgi:hypothetical protein